MKTLVYCLFFTGLIFISFEACKKTAPPEEVVLDETPYELNTGDFTPPDIPADNPLTKQGVALGRMLFYETQLSKDLSQSCASCHRQEHAFTDSARFSLGVEGKRGKRQAMSVFNTAWHTNGFFWDGRAPGLRDQALLPIQDPLEMNETLKNVVMKLEADQEYRDQFVRAFGSEVITPAKIGLALEQFMNTIVSVESKYDKYLRGETALTAEEERGRELFFAEFNPSFPDQSGADCGHCHTGINFENDRYMNNGLDTDAKFKDTGHEKVTGDAGDRAKFKVPSLRNVSVTAPFMHDGRFETLEEVIDHYNTGLKNSSTIDGTLVYPMDNGGLQLSVQDKADLIAFLHTLTDEDLLTTPEYSDPF